MKRAKLQIIILSLLIVYSVSCTSNNNGKTVRPKNFDEALSLGYSERVFDVPDTLFLGLHWGMDRKSVNSHLHDLAKTKQLNYSRGKYQYQYSFRVPCSELYSLTGYMNVDGHFSLHCEYQNDTLESITLTYDDPGVPVDVLYNEFNPGFSRKGYYTKGPFRFSTEERDRLFAWPEDKKCDPQHNYFFVKNNTLVWLDSRAPKLYDGFAFEFYPRISYYNLTLLHRGHSGRRALLNEQKRIKQEAIAKKMAEKEAAKRAF